MITIIDGLQLSGKTTLIEELNKNNEFETLKFNFSYYSKLFKINKFKIGPFQLGKDLSMLYFLKNQKENIIVDRGIFSTIYYSLLYKRLKKADILTLFDVLKKEYINYKFIFIIKINSNNEDNRTKNDGYDKLNKNINLKIIKFIKRECFIRNIDFKIFYNDFNKSIKYNANALKELLK